MIVVLRNGYVVVWLKVDNLGYLIFFIKWLKWVIWNIKVFNFLIFINVWF